MKNYSFQEVDKQNVTSLQMAQWSCKGSKDVLKEKRIRRYRS